MRVLFGSEFCGNYGGSRIVVMVVKLLSDG